MPAPLQCRRHVIEHLGGAGVVGDYVAVDGGHPARRRWVGVADVAESGVVHMEHGCWPLPQARLRELELGRAIVGLRRGLCGVRDGVADRAELQRDQVVELVAAVWSSGQPEPSARRDLLDGVFERRSWDVVALVHNHQSVAAGELLDVLRAGQGLQHRDVYYAAGLPATATELPGLDAQ